MATLGSQAVGSIVKLNVDGNAKNFIVVNQGLPGTMYDASCDGTWLLMEDVYVKMDNGTEDYENSAVDEYLNSTFYNLLGTEIAGFVKQVKIPYVSYVTGSGALQTGTSGLLTKIFTLSGVEFGFSSNDNLQAEGCALSYFDGTDNSKRIAYYNGNKTAQALRSPYSEYGYVATITANGGISYTAPGMGSRSERGQRPAMILPTNLSVLADGTITAPTGAITGSVNIGGVQRELTGKGYINIGGVLRELSDSQVNIGGILKSLKG